MEDIRPRTLAVGIVIIVVVQLGATIAFIHWPHEEPDSAQVAGNITYFPENDTARATIESIATIPEGPGNFTAAASWMENDTVYRSRTFPEPVRIGSSVTLRDVHPNSIVRIVWCNPSHCVIQTTKRITPTPDRLTGIQTSPE